MSNFELEKKTTKIAKLMCKQAGRPEAMWELALSDAYNLYCIEKEPTRSQKLNELGYTEEG